MRACDSRDMLGFAVCLLVVELFSKIRPVVVLVGGFLTQLQPLPLQANKFPTASELFHPPVISFGCFLLRYPPIPALSCMALVLFSSCCFMLGLGAEPGEESVLGSTPITV